MTRKQVPWKGWKNLEPSTHQRTIMLKQCGKKCFLGKNKSFPICKKNTCTICKKGVYAAYIRSREYTSRHPKYSIIAKKAKRMLTRKNL